MVGVSRSETNSGCKLSSKSQPYSKEPSASKKREQALSDLQISKIEIKAKSANSDKGASPALLHQTTAAKETSAEDAALAKPQSVCQGAVCQDDAPAG